VNFFIFKRVIISESIIYLLFNDLANLYNTSKYIFYLKLTLPFRLNIYFQNRDMVKDFNLRVKTWNVDSCIADILFSLVNNFHYYINYINNYDTILCTIDKLVTSNPKFRGFLLRFDNTHYTNMMT
jgi:hypothetical protein